MSVPSNTNLALVCFLWVLHPLRTVGVVGVFEVGDECYMDPHGLCSFAFVFLLVSFPDLASCFGARVQVALVAVGGYFAFE